MKEIKRSIECKYLERRIRELKNNFDFRQSINGITKRQSDQLKGLRLLCHAEFEDYFESKALKLLTLAEKRWTDKHIANYHLASLLVYHEKIEKKDDIQTKVYKIITDYKQLIRDNHGIKECNIKRMYEPLGYNINDFDAAFLSTLSSYGELRGEIAHLSTKHTQHSFDKYDEFDKIDEILRGIIQFEEVIRLS